jgi:sulfatase maturation enzyme AslB (radical SAM superfamily)
MLKYGNIFSYKFYTSGYLLTKDILKFLINYRTSFLLSVDGPEYITDKIRPTNDPKAESYYKRMEKVFPELLFYFPTVEWKTIIIKEYIDEVFNIYLEAENRGFNFIKFVLDFQTPDWEKEELERLKF